MIGMGINAFEQNAQPFTPEDFLNKLIPNFWSFLINLVALVVLFVALYFIAYKPVRKAIKARKDHVEKEMRDAEAYRAEQEAAAAKGEHLIDEARVEANQIIEKAKADASVSAEKIIQEAQGEAQRKQIEAEENIRQEEAKSRSRLHDEVVELTISAAETVLEREVNEEDHSRLISEFVEETKKKG